MKNRLILLLLVFVLTVTSVVSAQDSSQNVLNEDLFAEKESSSQYITIDGRSYRVSDSFVMPEWMSEDTPVMIRFGDDSNMIISLERLREDESDGTEMEYHFGIVNAITQANNNLDYRVYVNGVGYVFSSNTRIDESIARLAKYATVALVTYRGKAVMCKVLSSNVALPAENMFVGPVQWVKQEDDGVVISVNDGRHKIVDGTDIVGVVTEEGTWVYGYDVNGVTHFVAVLTDTFPKAQDAELFSGFITFVGSEQQNGSHYISVGGKALLITQTTALNDSLKVGDYVVGASLNGEILAVNKSSINYDKGKYHIYYQAIDDLMKIKDKNAPTGETLVEIYLGDKTIAIDSFTNIVGEIDKGVPVIVSMTDGGPTSVYVVNSLVPGRNIINGVVSGLMKTDYGYQILIDGNEYRTSFTTRVENVQNLALGSAVNGLADIYGNIDFLSVHENVMPSSVDSVYIGKIEQAASDGIDIEGKIFEIKKDITTVVGNIAVGKYAAVIGTVNYDAELVYVFPSEYADLNYKVTSGVLNGLHNANDNGNRTIRLDDNLFLLDSNTVINKILKYDEIGIALYRGLNEVSYIDVLEKPDDDMKHFSGKISKAVSSKQTQSAAFVLDGVQYSVFPVSALIDFDDITRIYPGATVEGYAYGNSVLAIRMVRAAGLFGVLNPPWLEYALVGFLLLLLLILFFVRSRKNRTYWVTGRVDIGPMETIIIHESNGESNTYQVSAELFEFLQNFKEQEITVKVHKGTIVDVR